MAFAAVLLLLLLTLLRSVLSDHCTCHADSSPARDEWKAYLATLPLVANGLLERLVVRLDRAEYTDSSMKIEFRWTLNTSALAIFPEQLHVGKGSGGIPLELAFQARMNASTEIFVVLLRLLDSKSFRTPTSDLDQVESYDNIGFGFEAVISCGDPARLAAFASFLTTLYSPLEHTNTQNALFARLTSFDFVPIAVAESVFSDSLPIDYSVIASDTATLATVTARNLSRTNLRMSALVSSFLPNLGFGAKRCFPQPYSGFQTPQPVLRLQLAHALETIVFNVTLPMPSYVLLIGSFVDLPFDLMYFNGRSTQVEDAVLQNLSREPTFDTSSGAVGRAIVSIKPSSDLKSLVVDLKVKSVILSRVGALLGHYVGGVSPLSFFISGATVPAGVSDIPFPVRLAALMHGGFELPFPSGQYENYFCDTLEEDVDYPPADLYGEPPPYEEFFRFHGVFIDHAQLGDDQLGVSMAAPANVSKIPCFIFSFSIKNMGLYLDWPHVRLSATPNDADPAEFFTLPSPVVSLPPGELVVAPYELPRYPASVRICLDMLGLTPDRIFATLQHLFDALYEKRVYKQYRRICKTETWQSVCDVQVVECNKFTYGFDVNGTCRPYGDNAGVVCRDWSVPGDPDTVEIDSCGEAPRDCPAMGFDSATGVKCGAGCERKCTPGRPFAEHDTVDEVCYTDGRECLPPTNASPLQKHVCDADGQCVPGENPIKVSHVYPLGPNSALNWLSAQVTEGDGGDVQVYEMKLFKLFSWIVLGEEDCLNFGCTNWYETPEEPDLPLELKLANRVYVGIIPVEESPNHILFKIGVRNVPADALWMAIDLGDRLELALGVPALQKGDGSYSDWIGDMLRFKLTPARFIPGQPADVEYLLEVLIDARPPRRSYLQDFLNNVLDPLGEDALAAFRFLIEAPESNYGIFPIGSTLADKRNLSGGYYRPSAISIENEFGEVTFGSVDVLRVIGFEKVTGSFETEAPTPSPTPHQGEWIVGPAICFKMGQFQIEDINIQGLGDDTCLEKFDFEFGFINPIPGLALDILSLDMKAFFDDDSGFLLTPAEDLLIAQGALQEPTSLRPFEPTKFNVSLKSGDGGTMTNPVAGVCLRAVLQFLIENRFAVDVDINAAIRMRTFEFNLHVLLRELLIDRSVLATIITSFVSEVEETDECELGYAVIKPDDVSGSSGVSPYDCGKWCYTPDPNANHDENSATASLLAWLVPFLIVVAAILLALVIMFIVLFVRKRKKLQQGIHTRSAQHQGALRYSSESNLSVRNSFARNSFYKGADQDPRGSFSKKLSARSNQRSRKSLHISRRNSGTMQTVPIPLPELRKSRQRISRKNSGRSTLVVQPGQVPSSARSSELIMEPAQYTGVPARTVSKPAFMY